MKLWKLPIITLFLILSNSANAALYSRLGGAAAYDDVLNITWATNASLAEVGTWNTQVAWADSLNYLGFDDWRLASMSVSAGLPIGSTVQVTGCSTATELDCRDNELGYMFYHNMGGGFDLTGNQIVGDVTFSNITSSYWSGTESPFAGGNTAAGFAFFGGSQGQSFDKDGISGGWAVRSGDVGIVPLPTAALLFFSGLISLLSFSRYKKS